MRAWLSTLTTRITIAMVALTVGTALAVAWWTHRETTRAALPGQLHRIQSHAELLAQSLDAHVEAASDDVLALSRSPVVLQVSQSLAAGRRPDRELELVRGHFRASLHAKPWILQLRLIAADESGRELVRVDRSGAEGTIRIVPDDALQEKGERHYVHEGRALPEGAVHVSPLELNQEGGRVERPFRPVVRVVTPVWEPSADRALALLVINVAMGPILESLASDLYPGSLVYVIDANGGYWRHATDPEMSFRFAAGATAERDEISSFVVDTGDARTATALVDGPDGERLGAGRARTGLEPGVSVVETAPYADMLSFVEGTTRATMSSTAIVLLGTLLLAILVSISLLRPLHLLTAAVQNLRTLDLSDAELPGRGEFATLSAALQQLATQVEGKTRSLEDEIEARKQALVEWQLAEERVRLVIDSSPNGLCVVDSDGNIVLINQAVEGIFGYARDELIGRSIDLLVPDDARSDHAGHRLKFMAEPSHRPMGIGRDLFARRKNGDLVAVEIGLCPLSLQGRDTVLASIVDITERRQQHLQLAEYAAELESKNAELEQMAYVVAHDVRAPLRGVATVAQWIAEDFGSVVDADARENLDLLLDRVDRLNRLITGILEYSHAGRGGASRVDVQTSALVRDVIASLAPPSPIEIRIQEPLPTVRYNETQLRQIFQNLIGNAIIHLGRPAGVVTISCDETATAWEFYVNDDGVAIPEKHFERIFQLFQTLQPKDESKSTGAGLAIVKRIVEANDGEVRVASSEESGTTFSFTVSKAS